MEHVDSNSCDCGTYGCQEVSYSITYTYECGVSKSITATWSITPTGSGYPSSGSISVTVPTGSGTKKWKLSYREKFPMQFNESIRFWKWILLILYSKKKYLR